MKAHILHCSKLTKKLDKILSNLDKNEIIIVTEQTLFDVINKKYTNDVIYIDLFSDQNPEDTINLVYEIMDDIKRSDNRINSKLEYSTDILINNFYYMIRITVNFLIQLEKCIEELGINRIVLYGGSNKVQFLAMHLAEGERPFQLLYKRSWFLNNFIYNTFKWKYDVEWKRKDSALYLKLVNIFRNNLVLSGKLITLLKKLIQVRRENKDIIINKKNPFAVILVRNPIQVSSLIPIYNEFKKVGEINPIFLSFENYSNNSLTKELSKYKVNNFNLIKLLTFSNVLKVYKNIFFMNQLKKSQLKKYKINNIELDLDLKNAINELKINWFDAKILKLVLDRVEEILNKDIKVLINNETHGYYAALQAMWAKQRGIVSVGIQHVIISERLIPRISWNDVMFTMSKETAEKLTLLKPNEKFIYAGPVAYDEYFNTTQHDSEFNNISIFTQPDDYTTEYIQIIKDLIDIRKRNNLSFKINVKLHPREKNINLFYELKELDPTIDIIANEVNSLQLIVRSDLVLSIHSGTLMQAIIIGTPSISINYDQKFKINVDFIQDDVTKKVYSKKELEAIFMDLDNFNKQYNVNRRKYLENKLGNYNGKAASRIYSILKDIIASNNNHKI